MRKVLITIHRYDGGYYAVCSRHGVELQETVTVNTRQEAIARALSWTRTHHYIGVVI